MTNTPRILTKVADQLNIQYSFVDTDKTFIKLDFPKGPHFMINSALGLISNSEDKITLDKSYQYDLLKDHEALPKTKSYLDPKSEYAEFAKFNSIEEIVVDICQNYSFPLIIKKNRGSEGAHVFKVDGRSEVQQKVEVIFNQRSHGYDYILLAQQYIQPAYEYRVVFYNEEIFLAYIKDTRQATYTSNLSPLHWENARAILVSEVQYKKLKSFVDKFLTIWPIKYAGLDIIEDQQGKLWLIEVNSAPGFAYYIRDNGEEKVFTMMKTILSDLKARYS